MSSEPSTPPLAGSRSLPDDLRSDVLDIISDTVQWRLPEARWAEIEELVKALHEALHAGDLQAVEQALGALELAAPLRITPIGGEPTRPAPLRLRNLAQQVVHDLGEGLESDARHDLEALRDENGSGDGTGR
jgi:CATRA-associated small protein